MHVILDIKTEQYFTTFMLVTTMAEMQGVYMLDISEIVSKKLDHYN